MKKVNRIKEKDSFWFVVFGLIKVWYYSKLYEEFNGIIINVFIEFVYK